MMVRFFNQRNNPKWSLNVHKIQKYAPVTAGKTRPCLSGDPVPDAVLGPVLEDVDAAQQVLSVLVLTVTLEAGVGDPVLGDQIHMAVFSGTQEKITYLVFT